MKAKYEPRLTSIDVESMSTYEFIQFVVNRESFLRDYGTFKKFEEGKIRERVSSVLCSQNLQELYSELIICFQAALEVEARPSYYFNLFVIDLIERLYSDFLYLQGKVDMRLEHLPIEDTPSSVCCDWVFSSRSLSPYQRYLLFEYLALGYSLEALARRRHCTVRTIQNHINQILDFFGL